MKKNYKILSSVRLVVATLVILFSVSQAFAGETKNYWYYNTVSSYPTAGGTVYMSTSETADSLRDYQSEQELKYLAEQAYAGSTYFYTYAKPNDGYIFIGWKKLDTKYYDDVIEDPSVEMKDYLSNSIVDYKQETSFYLSTTASSENKDVEYYNLTPDNAIVALFGHLSLKYVPGQSELGTLEAEDPSVEIGGFTYIKATPASPDSTKFLYWLDDEGNKYTDNPLEIEVKRNVTYTAVFDNPDYKLLDFTNCDYKLIGAPADLNVEYDNDYVNHVYVTPQVMTSYEILDHYDTVMVKQAIERDTTIAGVDTTVTDSQLVQQVNPVYTTTYYESYKNSMYGQYITDANSYSYGFNFGTATLVHALKRGLVAIKYTTPGQYDSPFANTYLVSAGSEGVSIDTLSADKKYYTFDETTNTFNVIKSGVVPAGSGYLALPLDNASAKYDKIYFVTEEEYNKLPSMPEDVNGDNAVDSQDVLKIYDFMKTATGTEESPVEDVNGDKSVDSQDILKVYDYIKNH